MAKNQTITDRRIYRKRDGTLTDQPGNAQTLAYAKGKPVTNEADKAVIVKMRAVYENKAETPDEDKGSGHDPANIMPRTGRRASK